MTYYEIMLINISMKYKIKTFDILLFKIENVSVNIFNVFIVIFLKNFF